MTQFINTQRGSKGEPWERWLPWASINSAAFDGNDIVYWLTDWNTVRLVDWKTELTWPQWETWPAATITVWSTTTWNPWTNASVTNSGTSSAAVFNFTIPRWANWQDWQDWAAATISAWSASTLPAGSTPTVTNSGTSSAAVFNFGIPKGDTWATGNGIASVTSSKSWKVTTVTITETDWDSSSFTVSDGADWEWSWDVVWPASSTDWDIVLFDGVTGKLIKDSWKAFTPAWIWALPDSTKYWASIAVSVDTSNYKITTTLKDQDWNTLGTAQVIDLPLESVVVSGSYDSVNKKIILTLEWWSTIEFSVADLVSGLQSEIDANNKLDADLVDDTNSTHKFVTTSEKSTYAGKQDALIAWTNIQIAADGKTISATDTKYNAATSSDLWLVKLWSDTVQSVAAWTATWATWRTYPIQVDANGLMVVNIPWENTTYNAATQSDAWLMSAADKTKLDGIATWATANTGTLTEIVMNGVSQGTSWSIDLWTVLTSHQSIKTINWNTITGTWNLSLYSSISITLAAADWSSNEQTVTATWATASNIIIVSPDTSNMDDYASNKVYCSAQASNSLTFSCDTEPENDIVVNVLIMN